MSLYACRLLERQMGRGRASDATPAYPHASATYHVRYRRTDLWWETVLSGDNTLLRYDSQIS